MAQDSALTGLRAEHVRLIGTYWVRFNVRTGGGLMTLLLVLIAGLSVASIFITPVEQLMQASPEVGHSEEEAVALVQKLAESDQIVDIVRWITGSEEGEAEYLLRDNPALLSVIMLVLLMVFPFIACVAGFNQTAGDISNRGLRYLLLRTERPNIFFGRFLGTLGFSALALAVVFVILALYVGFKFSIYGFGEIFMWSAQGYVACVFLVLPYLALCAWVSSMIDSAFGALAVSLLLTGFPIIFLKLLDVAIKGDQGWLERLTPWGWKYDLLSGDIATRVIGYGMMVAFTVLFLFLGIRHFTKRDL